MYVVIRSASGATLEGMVLALGRDRMRVALRGSPDVVELRRSYSQWFSDRGDLIEFDALVSDGHFAASHAEMFPMTLTGHA